MYLVVLCLFVLKLKPSSSELFPDHLDLQKVGEIIFNNEKYKILRPTTHRITDYFKDFMLRRENVDFPNKRVFLDDNGFRHYWSGFDEKTKSLRKTEILTDAIETVSNKAENKIAINKSDNNHKTNSSSTKEANSAATTETSKNSGKLIVRSGAENSTGEATNNKDSENNVNKVSDEINTTTTTEGHDIKVYKHPKQFKNEESDENVLVTSKDIRLRGGALPLAGDKERTIATTTFFCPHFGTVIMSKFLDEGL